MTYLHHVTLTTGHVARSTRDAADGAILACRRILRGPQPAAIPATDLTLEARQEGRCLVASISRSDDVLVRLWVADHSRPGAALWRRLGAPGPCPPEPWCAVEQMPGLTSAPRPVVEMLGDLERCLAWAWIVRDATTVALWDVLPEQHAAWSAAGCGDLDVAEYHERLAAAANEARRSGALVCLVEAEVQEVIAELEVLGAANDPAGRAAAIGSIAARRGLV